eukprot:SAG31_NODE_5130_length_2724_cov_1.619048_2_plen_190_part_00
MIETKSTKFAVGDAVLAMPPNYWKANLANRPEWYDPATHAVLEEDFYISGGFAEYMTSHELYCYKVQKLSKEMVIGQGLGTVLRMLRKLGGSMLGQRVVLLGQGQNGLMATRLIADMKARTVLAVDPIDNRRATARKMGATHVCTPTELQDRVDLLTDGQGFDIVVCALRMVLTNRHLSLIETILRTVN